MCSLVGDGQLWGVEMRLSGPAGAPGGRIAIVSPFDVWCAGIEAIIRQSGWLLTGRWRTLEEVLAERALGDADVVLVSKRLVARPVGLSDFRPLAEAFAGPLILAIETDDQFLIDDFLALDVEGFMLSTASLNEVVDCLDNVMRGRRWVDPNIRTMLGHVPHGCASQSKLSARERQVAQLAAAGLSNKRIARVLQVSGGTVKMHMHHILSKLQLSSRIELIRPGTVANADEIQGLMIPEPFIAKVISGEPDRISLVGQD